MDYTPAQTIIQLYKQLHLAGYSEADVSVVQSSYEFAVRLFSSRYRANGKTFLAHLVGAASVVAYSGGSIQEVVAGMLHSTYSLGEFGDASRGATKHKRQIVTRILGEEIEQIIYEFPSLQWKDDDLERLARALVEQLTAGERRLIRLRLAHEVEEHSDWAFVYSRKLSRERVRQRLLMAEQIADNLGLDELVGAIRSLIDDVNSKDLPQPSDSVRAETFLVPPATHRERVLLTVKQRWWNLHRSLRRQLRRFA
jgi:(p)ppGpp synthase/HD superfamily hydrolase